MRKVFQVCALVAAQMLLLSPSYAQTRDISVHGQLLDRIAAIVNDGLVLKSELDDQMASVQKRLQEQKVELPSQSVLQQQVLDRLVLQEIQMQRAKHVGLTITDEQLNGALQEIAARNKIPFDQLPTALAAQGVDYKLYRESMRKELTLSTLRQRDVIAHINVSPHELDQYLAREQNAAANDEFNVSHILLSLPAAATPQQLDEISHKAQDVAARAGKGEDFGQLAISNSNSQTALDGGQLGWRKGAQLPQFILDLVVKMKPGEVSAPVRTPSGYHIVKLNERRSGEAPVIINQLHVRHILMKPNELDDDATVREKLAKLRERILNGEDFAGIASTSSEDPGSAPDGGDLGWSGPGTFVPEFDKAIADLKPNEISEPFKTRYGWHIVQMLGTRTYDSTDDVRRQKRLRRSVRARRTKKPNCGCAA
jgi:peptidyl-prolyl cis-trans isomerase SurA